PNMDADLFDPVSGMTKSFLLSVPRANHAAARTADGRVLVGGGEDPTAPYSTYELFDPVTETIGPPFLGAAQRGLLALVPLADGRLLAYGGQITDVGAAGEI